MCSSDLYEYPIRANKLRPARETCEKCHSPEKFSDDSLCEIKHYGDDRDNTPTSTYLILHTGGGTQRVGLGRGIHWHIEAEVDYLPLDPQEQQIPYVRVVNSDGSTEEYIEVGSGIDPETIDPSQLKRMDCITCHNRITHLIPAPDDTVDELISRGLVSESIPEIHRRGTEALSTTYDSVELALNAIAGLEGYYQTYYAEFYQANRAIVQAAIEALQEAYQQSVFPHQKEDWASHPNNVGHEDSPGCFRCHNYEMESEDGDGIATECDTCHSILTQVSPEEDPEGDSVTSNYDEGMAVLHPKGDEYVENQAACSDCHNGGYRVYSKNRD